MNFLLILMVIVVAAAVLILKMKQSPTDGGLEFAKREGLFTPAERSFLGVLEQALDSRYRVFGKVRLGDIVKPAKGLSNSNRATANNKINQKHLKAVAGIDPCFSCNDRLVTIERRGGAETWTWAQLRRYGIEYYR